MHATHLTHLAVLPLGRQDVTRDDVLALLDMRLKEKPSPSRRSVPQSLFFGEDESEEGS
jgi:hypothetical protein